MSKKTYKLIDANSVDQTPLASVNQSVPFAAVQLVGQTVADATGATLVLMCSGKRVPSGIFQPKQ